MGRAIVCGDLGSSPTESVYGSPCAGRFFLVLAMDKKPGAMKGVKKPAHPALGTKFIDRKTQRLRIPANKPVK